MVEIACMWKLFALLELVGTVTKALQRTTVKWTISTYESQYQILAGLQYTTMGSKGLPPAGQDILNL